MTAEIGESRLLWQPGSIPQYLEGKRPSLHPDALAALEQLTAEDMLSYIIEPHAEHIWMQMNNERQREKLIGRMRDLTHMWSASQPEQEPYQSLIFSVLNGKFQNAQYQIQWLTLLAPPAELFKAITTNRHIFTEDNPSLDDAYSHSVDSMNYCLEALGLLVQYGHEFDANGINFYIYKLFDSQKVAPIPTELLESPHITERNKQTIATLIARHTQRKEDLPIEVLWYAGAKQLSDDDKLQTSITQLLQEKLQDPLTFESLLNHMRATSCDAESLCQLQELIDPKSIHLLLPLLMEKLAAYTNSIAPGTYDANVKIILDVALLSGIALKVFQQQVIMDEKMTQKLHSNAFDALLSVAEDYLDEDESLFIPSIILSLIEYMWLNPISRKAFYKQKRIKNILDIVLIFQRRKESDRLSPRMLESVEAHMK